MYCFACQSRLVKEGVDDPGMGIPPYRITDPELVNPGEIGKLRDLRTRGGVFILLHISALLILPVDIRGCIGHLCLDLKGVCAQTLCQLISLAPGNAAIGEIHDQLAHLNTSILILDHKSTAEHLLHARRIGIVGALAGIHRPNLVHLIPGQFEVEDVQIGSDALGICGLWQRDDALLHLKTQDDLSGIFAILFSQRLDRRIGQQRSVAVAQRIE